MVKHTISLESREVKGKYLVIKFVFDIYNDGGGLVCNSLDKYLPTHAWSKIYEKLNKSIEQYVEKDMQRPSKKMIKIHSFQLQLSCSWADFNEMYRSLLGDDTSGGTVDQSADRIFYPYILTVKVHQLSRIDEFDKNRSKAELLAKDRAESKEIDDAPQSTTATSSGIQVGKCEPSSPTSRKRHHEEYVPSATTVSPKHSKLTYTPSKSVEAKADEYTPCEFVSADATTAEAIGYRYYPSPINNNNRNEYPLNTSKPYSRGQIKSPRPNRTRSKLSMIDAIEASEPSAVDKSSTKANLSPDLFGESPNTADEVNSPTEASVELPISPRKRSKRRAKVITQRTIDSFTIPKTASSSSSSTSLSSSSKTSTSSAKVSSTARCSPLHKRSKSTVDRKTNKNDDDASKREEEELQTIHEKIRRKIESNTLTDHRGNQIGLTRLIDLKDLSIEEVTGTFDENSDELMRIFEERKFECRPQPQTEYSVDTVIQSLLKEVQMKKMVDTLTDKLTNPEKDGDTPFHHLFWTLMLPEWTLLIFMKRYDLTRKEALEQVRRYDLACALNSTFDFDQFKF